MKSTLIFISGFSCTGKTTLARKIGKHYSLPVFGRDDFKESLFDSLGYLNRERSQELGIASYKLLYLTMDKLLSVGSSLIVESNFKANLDTEKFKNLKDKYQCNLLQIHCHVEMSLALARFKMRSQLGARHPGHVDHLILEEMESNFKQGGYEIRDICDATLRIDTTNFEEIDYENIFASIEDYVSLKST